MPKKIVSLPLCISLFLISTVFAPCTFAADVETVGDLKVGGVVESTSGGFKFPDGTTWTTGSMDGLHFNVGFVVDDSNSNAGNLTSGAIKFGTGATGEGIASQRLAGDNQNGIDLYTNSTSRLAITNNGYIGIGTRTPTFPLDVHLNRNYTHARFGVSTYPLFVIANMPQIGFNAYYDVGYKYGSDGYAGYLAFGQGITGGFSFATAPSGVLDNPATLTRRMVITNDGKVGIGITSPSQTLDVAGNIKASGTIAAGPGLTGTPFAYASYSSSGTKAAGTANITCTWDGTLGTTTNRWICRLYSDATPINYSSSNYIVSVTPTLASTPRMAVTNLATLDGIGVLVVRIFDLSGTSLQAGFSVVLYEP